MQGVYNHIISIHALREESDELIAGLSTFWSRFQSTPSARRATHPASDKVRCFVISIHALREESDGSTLVLWHPRS